MGNIFKIIQISKPLHHLVAIIGSLIVVGAMLDLLPPILSKFIIDEIVKQIQTGSGDIGKLGLLVALVFSIGLIGEIIGTASERLGDHFAGRLRKFLTDKFYAKVLTLPQSYFDSEISGKIIHQLNRAIFSIQNFINSSTNFILPLFLQAVFTVVVLVFYSLPIAFLVAILFPIYLTLSYFSAKKWGEREVEKNKIEDISRGRINEVVGNIKLVKSFNREFSELGFVNKKLDESNKIYAQQSITFHKFDFVRNLSLIIILLLINIVAFYNTFQGHLSIGSLVLIIQLVSQARRPLFAMSFVLTHVQNAEAGSKEYFEVLSLDSKEDFTEDENLLKLTNPSLEFKNVSFNYEQGEKVLDEVSFKIFPKETVALVGHSGAGKTTIVNLILKFYDPSQGNLLISDESYQDLSASEIRNNISLVLQENELFSSTVRENVAYGKPNATDEEITTALKKANAFEFVQNLPKGLDSEIGERGVKLSGGQKQRLQIARAIVKDSPILILDEATSSLDAKSEKEVQEALENLMQDKLVLIIAHRFSTLQNVQKIVVINEGKIVDSGTPGELSKRKGIYSELLNYQIEGNKKLLETFELY